MFAAACACVLCCAGMGMFCRHHLCGNVPSTVFGGLPTPKFTFGKDHLDQLPKAQRCHEVRSLRIGQNSLGLLGAK